MRPPQWFPHWGMISLRPNHREINLLDPLKELKRVFWSLSVGLWNTQRSKSWRCQKLGQFYSSKGWHIPCLYGGVTSTWKHKEIYNNFLHVQLSLSLPFTLNQLYLNTSLSSDLSEPCSTPCTQRLGQISTGLCHLCLCLSLWRNWSCSWERSGSRGLYSCKGFRLSLDTYKWALRPPKLLVYFPVYHCSTLH